MASIKDRKFSIDGDILSPELNFRRNVFLCGMSPIGRKSWHLLQMYKVLVNFASDYERNVRNS